MKLVLSAMESNLQSVHTDCPIWERLGWLETSQLMAPSIIYNKDARELLRKIARDAAEAQYENGFIPNVAPAYWNSPAWGSAAVIVPWLLYEYYGDTYSLEENYEAMKKYAEYFKSKEDANGVVMQGLGDWTLSLLSGSSAIAAAAQASLYELLAADLVANKEFYTADAVEKSELIKPTRSLPEAVFILETMPALRA